MVPVVLSEKVGLQHLVSISTVRTGMVNDPGLFGIRVQASVLELDILPFTH